METALHPHNGRMRTSWIPRTRQSWLPNINEACRTPTMPHRCSGVPDEQFVVIEQQLDASSGEASAEGRAKEDEKGRRDSREAR
eukprot:2181234-Amphidinium_carterae.1